MGTIVTDDKHYRNIANTLREKLDTEDSFKPEEMADGIAGIFEAGGKTAIKEWWDTYLKPMRAGKPSNNAFSGPCWNGETFYPTQDIIPLENATSLFERFSWNAPAARIDLAQRLEDCGVVLDISNVTIASYIFNYAWVTRVPALNCNTTKYSNLTSFFANAPYLVTIDELIIRNDGTNNFSNTFDGSKALANIKITGVIGKNISFSSCPLSVASMKNIISCLKDYSGTDSEFVYKVTFSSACKTALEAEGATAEYNGVPCTWIALIENKKWNG
jgi:hypothetical protein